MEITYIIYHHNKTFQTFSKLKKFKKTLKKSHKFALISQTVQARVKQTTLYDHKQYSSFQKSQNCQKNTKFYIESDHNSKFSKISIFFKHFIIFKKLKLVNGKVRAKVAKIWDHNKNLKKNSRLSLNLSQKWLEIELNG